MQAQMKVIFWMRLESLAKANRTLVMIWINFDVGKNGAYLEHRRHDGWLIG